MSNVIALASRRVPKSVDDIRQEQSIHSKRPLDQEYQERLRRIKESLTKINALITELKKTTNQNND